MMKNIINKYAAAISVIVGVLITFCFVCLAVPPTPPTVNITGNAATATALASNPTDCGANTVATAIDASGNLTCSQSIGTIATQNADNATITGGNVTGLTTLTADTMSANVVKTTTTADATLSGTPIIITVYDAASNTPYYFKAYPTK
jgi:hypothetical protein